MNCKWHSKYNPNLTCNEKADSDGYCIFHKNNKTDEEKNLFFKKIKEKQISDFTGFNFENEFNIKEVITYEYEKLKFDEAVFFENANFENFQFKNTINFKGTEFKSFVSFKNSHFLYNCVFNNVKFNYKYINEFVFQKSNFNGQKLIIEECINLPRLDGIIFSPYTKFILKDINYNKENAICGMINYKIARIQSKITEDIENIGYYYYNERNYTSYLLKNSEFKGYKDYWSKNFFDFLSRKCIGYGEKPMRLLLISIFIISTFALIYMITGINTAEYGLIKLNLINNNYTLYQLLIYYLEAWYFSMITFSTVGYGEIIAFGVIGKLFVCMEIFLGITIHATWTSVLFSRMIK